MNPYSDTPPPPPPPHSVSFSYKLPIGIAQARVFIHKHFLITWSRLHVKWLLSYSFTGSEMVHTAIWQTILNIEIHVVVLLAIYSTKSGIFYVKLYSIFKKCFVAKLCIQFGSHCLDYGGVFNKTKAIQRVSVYWPPERTCIPDFSSTLIISAVGLVIRDNLDAIAVFAPFILNHLCLHNVSLTRVLFNKSNAVRFAN